MRRGVSKKGVSPVIATVLLVVMVVVIGLVIFMWFESFTQEAVTKFGGRNIALVCQDVQLQSSYQDGTISISNSGNVPVYSVKLKITSGKNYETLDVETISSSWPALTGLRQGGIFSDDAAEIGSAFSGATSVVVIPVLIGTSDSGDKTHNCGEDYGQEIIT